MDDFSSSTTPPWKYIYARDATDLQDAYRPLELSDFVPPSPKPQRAPTTNSSKRKGSGSKQRHRDARSTYINEGFCAELRQHFALKRSGYSSIFGCDLATSVAPIIESLQSDIDAISTARPSEAESSQPPTDVPSAVDIVSTFADIAVVQAIAGSPIPIQCFDQPSAELLTLVKTQAMSTVAPIADLISSRPFQESFASSLKATLGLACSATTQIDPESRCYHFSTEQFRHLSTIRDLHPVSLPPWTYPADKWSLHPHLVASVVKLCNRKARSRARFKIDIKLWLSTFGHLGLANQSRNIVDACQQAIQHLHWINTIFKSSYSAKWMQSISSTRMAGRMLHVEPPILMALTQPSVALCLHTRRCISAGRQDCSSEPDYPPTDLDHPLVTVVDGYSHHIT